MQVLLAGCVSNPSEHQRLIVKDSSDRLGVTGLWTARDDELSDFLNQMDPDQAGDGPEPLPGP